MPFFEISRHPQRRHHATLPSFANVGHRSYHQPMFRQPVRQPTLLLIAENDLISHLARFLCAHGYTVHSAVESSAIKTKLANSSIDLLLFHCAPRMSYGGWETYTQLRQWTMKPVLMVANITVEHFMVNPNLTENGTMDNSGKRDELMDYLDAVALLCRTMLPQPN